MDIALFRLGMVSTIPMFKVFDVVATMNMLMHATSHIAEDIQMRATVARRGFGSIFDVRDK